MLQSLALIFLCGWLLGRLFVRLRLPGLLGMLLTGILLGPYGLDLLDPSLLAISAELRQIALIMILARAGLTLNTADLKAVGRPAVFMCFLPACCEILGVILLAPRLLGVSVLEAAILGSVVAAVSPAVIVPGMLHLMERGYGTRKHIPQLLMAGASVDDVFVIVLFTAFTGLAQGEALSPLRFVQIPVAIGTGLVGGALLGALLGRFFAPAHPARRRIRDSEKVVILLSFAFLLVAGEQAAGGWLPFSGLLAVMSMGAGLRRKRPEAAGRISAKLAKLWVAAELCLFVLVGATVDLGAARAAGGAAVLLIVLVLPLRMAGVLLSLLGTQLTAKERVFCMVAYLPKATVQAAIGSLPLAMGLACGPVVLTAAVCAILITAPLGALGIQTTYTKLLQKEEGENQ